MAFSSDAHRRWWFANRGSGGTGSSGAGGGAGGVSSGSVGSSTASTNAGYSAYMADPQRQIDRVEYAKAMFPGMDEADALRTLNDREGLPRG